MSRLVDQLPRVPDPPQADSYLAVLDMILADREINQAEADQLVHVATDLGLTRSQVDELHQVYVTDLADALWSGGSITPEERARPRPGRSDARPRDWSTSTTPYCEQATAQYAVPTRPGSRGFPVGSTLVFTGDMVEPREVWWNRALAAGFVPQEAVQPDTTFVVAADVDSLSVKARTARSLGIPIIATEDFLHPPTPNHQQAG